MHILLIGFIAPDYVIALANVLTKTNNVTLFLAKQRLASYFPKSSNLEIELRNKQLLDSAVNLYLIEYPKGSYFRKVRLIFELKQKIFSIHPDVIHYQSGSSVLISFLLPWLHHFPIVITIHDPFPHSGSWLAGMIARFDNQLMTRSANQLIVHGREQADVLQKAYRLNLMNINVIPHISQDMYNSNISAHQASVTHKVLFFGRLRAYKGLEVLIRAAPLIAASVSDMRIVICGSGYYPIVHEAAAKNPSWFEVHNRFIEADEVPSIFQQAAIVVLPYLDATQTGIIPIAYRFGRPVVASRVGSIPEVVDDGMTGYLVTPGDEKSLAEAIIRLLQNDSMREKMGKAAKAKLENDLSSSAIAYKTIQVYKRAIESKMENNGQRGKKNTS